MNNVDKLCRICLNEAESVKPLSYCLSNGQSIYDILAFTTHIKLTNNSNYPQQICTKCEFSAIQAHSFKLQCLTTEKKLCEITNQQFIAIKPEKRSETPENVLNPYQCSICLEKYSNLHFLDSHVSSHLIDTCTLNQNVTIDNYAALDVKEEENFDYDCINSPMNEDAECKQYIKVKQCYSCDHCQLEFHHKKSLIIHIEKKHASQSKESAYNNLELKPYCCTSCGSRFKSQKNLNTHFTRKHFVNKYVTELEDSVPIKLEKQSAKLLKPSNIHCPKCMRKFKYKDSLQRHLKMHEEKEQETHICNICKREFQHLAHLNNHKASAHSSKELMTTEKKHTCKFCSKSFTMLSALKDHERTHTGEKPFLCSMCGRRFSQRTNLKEHVRRHMGMKPYKCNDCDQRFVSKGELVSHTRKHTGAHPFKCEVCNATFTMSGSLVKHRRIHTGERPYGCDICVMRFKALSTLKNHKLTHTGEKPFKCSYCEKSFVQKSDLTSHIRVHTGERPFVCTTCGQTFRQNSALKTHIKIHHLKAEPRNE